MAEGPETILQVAKLTKILAQVVRVVPVELLPPETVKWGQEQKVIEDEMRRSGVEP